MRPGRFLRQEIAGAVLRRLAPLLSSLAFRWRSTLHHTCFVAVTGSMGKSTAKECLGAILSSRAPTFVSVGNQNAGHLLALNLLRVRPWHRYAVIETAAARPGWLREAGRLVQPQLALIISIAQAHTSSLGRLDGIAREKLSLLDHLDPSATVIVNGDEPRLREAGKDRGLRVLRFGTAAPPGTGKAEELTPSPADLDLVVDNASSTWPERLHFTAWTKGTSVQVATRLVGTHWTPAVSAALLAAEALGVPLEEAAQSVAKVEPQTGRMQPFPIPGGVTVIRDDYNGAPASWDAAFEVMAGARVQRRVLVAGDYSDHWLGPRPRLQRMGRAAARWAALAAFVSPNGHYAAKGALGAGLPSACVWWGSAWEDAAKWLKARLQPGDLVLLKGRVHEHLARLLFALTGPVDCHKQVCYRRYLCDDCWNLGVPADRLRVSAGETGSASADPWPGMTECP